MNLDMMLPIFSVAWHWMLKTCIQLSITIVESLAVRRKRASNEQQCGRPITTQVVGHGTQSQRDRWDCLKFHHVTNLSGQGFQRQNLHDEGMSKRLDIWILCTTKKLPWQGLELCQTFCTNRKSKLEKESTFLQTVWQPQTSAQYPASLRGFIIRGSTFRKPPYFVPSKPQTAFILF